MGPPLALLTELGLPTDATFATQNVFSRPSLFIQALVRKLPRGEELTRDQTLFLVRFATACDCAWEERDKDPKERSVHHLLLLGQGGSGKTHVVQKIIFVAVAFIWPQESPLEPTLQVVASSNAQAKNISTASVKARTIHNATCMRVQKYVNPKMRPGNKQSSLTRLWDKVMVLVIEEISMVAASLYNMLDFRAMYGRSRTHNVHEQNYSRKGHAFGRIPIVIHLGGFFQLKPTANLSHR